MLGYIAAAQAKKYGMTHHGSYYGLPVWLAPEHPDFMCCAKWAPMEYVMTAFHHIEGFMRSILYPGDEPGFQFKIGKPL